MTTVFEPLVTALSVSILMGSEAAGMGLMMEWGLAARFHPDPMVDWGLRGLALVPALWLSVVMFRRVWRIERAGPVAAE